MVDMYRVRKNLPCLAIVLVMTILAPLITYAYITNTYNIAIDSYKNQIEDLQHKMNSLSEQNRQLTEENSKLTEILQPHLITSLGWYLHTSNDPVASSRNIFTVYGKISNTGLSTANNVELTIKFYGNDTLLQTSKISVGSIQSLNSTEPFVMIRKDVACSEADFVKYVDVSLSYQ